MNIYLVQGSHPVVPSHHMIPYATLEAAKAKALELVNCIRLEPVGYDYDADPSGAPILLPQLPAGGDWQEGMREWQRAKLLHEGYLEADVEAFGDDGLAEEAEGDVYISDLELEGMPDPAEGMEALVALHQGADVPAATMPVPRVVVTVSGGVLTGAVTDLPAGAIKVIVLDYDTDGADEVVMIDDEAARMWEETPEPGQGAWIDALEALDSDAAFVVEPDAMKTALAEFRADDRVVENATGRAGKVAIFRPGLEGHVYVAFDDAPGSTSLPVGALRHEGHFEKGDLVRDPAGNEGIVDSHLGYEDAFYVGLTGRTRVTAMIKRADLTLIRAGTGEG